MRSCHHGYAGNGDCWECFTADLAAETLTQQLPPLPKSRTPIEEKTFPKYKPPEERVCAGNLCVDSSRSRTELRKYVINSFVRWPSCPKHCCDLMLSEGTDRWTPTGSRLRCPHY